MLGRRRDKSDEANAVAFELLVDEEPEPLAGAPANGGTAEPGDDSGDFDPGMSVEQKIEQLAALIRTSQGPAIDVRAENEALRQELTSAIVTVSQRLHAAMVDMGQRLSEETGQLRAAVAGRPPGAPAVPGAPGAPGAPAGPDRSTAELLKLAGSIDRKLDRLAEVVTTPPPPAPPPPAGVGAADVEALRADLRTALTSLAQQFQAALGKVHQRVTDETSQLRGVLEAALGLLMEQPAGDRHERLAELTSTNELIRSLFAEQRAALARELEEVAGGGGRRGASGDDLAGLGTELKAVLREINDQREDDRRERRAELRSALAKTAETIRSVLVDERQELRSELQLVLPDLLRHRGEEWQQLRAAFDAAMAETRERTLNLAQLSQRVSELRAELQVTSGRTHDEFVQLRSEMSAVAGGAPPQTAPPVELLARWEQLRTAVESALAAAGDRTQLAATQLGQQLADLRYELESTAGRAAEQRSQEMAELRSEIATTISRMYDEQAAQWQELRSVFESSADQIQVPLADLGARLAEVRGDLHLRLGGVDEQLALVAERQAGNEVTPALAEIADLVRQQASEQAELRRVIAGTIEAANASLVGFRDDLYGRLESIIDVTAQSSASAAASVKALRRDLEEIDRKSSLHESLNRLHDDIVVLRQKMPARVALYLPESQLAAIADAAQQRGLPRARPAEPPEETPRPRPARTAAKRAKAPAAKKSARRRSV